MRHRWFWGTLTAWILIMTALTGRALIYRDAPAVRSEGRFRDRVNGRWQTHEVFTTPGGLSAFDALRDQWGREGWVPVAEGMDLVGALLGNPTGGVPGMDLLVRGEAFRRGDRMRLLTIGRMGTGSCAWTTEMPEAVLDDRSARERWRFPLRPPDGAVSLLCVEAGALRAAVWRQGPKDGELRDLAARQGYECRALDANQGGPCVLMTRGRRQVVAFTRDSGGDRIVALLLMKE
jgi:hypothetical protein